jgi:hypothetical protein
LIDFLLLFSCFLGPWSWSRYLSYIGSMLKSMAPTRQPGLGPRESQGFRESPWRSLRLEDWRFEVNNSYGI